MLRLMAMILFGLLLAGCAREPAETVLRTDVEAALATAFGKDTFRVVALARRGSATDSTAPAGEARRVAYYDLELELTRDLELGGWDDPGAATLISLLGAGPRSISGVKSAGNVAGDRIVAHASAIYRDDGGRWTLVMPAGFHEAEEPRADTGAPARPSQQALQRLADITRSVEAGGSRVAQSVLDQELQRSVARLSGRLARVEQGYPLAAGRDRGEYAAFASALADVAQKRELRIVPLITGGGEENIDMLRGGSVQVALAQADTALAAYEGTGPFAGEGSFASLRALGSLYPEYVHIVVRADTAFNTAADLKGARIAVGPEDSAVRDTVKRVLSAHGLEAGRDYEMVSTRFGEALPALQRGEIDAATHVVGLPVATLRDALTGGAVPLKLLPLKAEAVQAVAAKGRGLISASIPAGVYPGQRESVATVAVPALLLTTEGFDRDEAARLVRVVYEGGNDLLARGSAQGSQVSVHTALRGLTVPLHPGAQQALSALQAPTAPASETITPAPAAR